MLLLGAIVSDEWASIGERISYALISICILAVCQPSAFIRFLQWLWESLISMFRMLKSRLHSNKPLSHDIVEEDSYVTVNCSESDPYEPSTPVDIPRKNARQIIAEAVRKSTRGEISNTGSTTHEEAHTKYGYTYPDSYEYNPPAKVSRGNISILSDDEMHVFLRYYYKADEIRTKVKGVTFRNDDGTDRQNILAHCHSGDQLRFKFYEYEGTPAYAVYCDWGQIGNLAAELAKEITAREKPCIILGEILDVSGGYHGDYFGCNICLNIYEKHKL